MVGNSADAERDRTIVVGLVADPGLPADVTRRVSADLPVMLSRRVDSQVSWTLQTSHESLPVNDQGEIPLLEHARERMPREGWDVMVYLTDLPQRAGTQPVLAEVGSAQRVALISLPAVGWIRLRPHALETVVHVVGEITGAEAEQSRGGSSGHQFHRRPTELVSPAGESAVMIRPSPSTCTWPACEAEHGCYSAWSATTGPGIWCPVWAARSRQPRPQQPSRSSFLPSGAWPTHSLRRGSL